MWGEKLLQLILKLSYYKALFTAVIAAPINFNTWQLHPSRIYTIYCAAMHIGYLALIPFTYSRYVYKRSYMVDMPVVQRVYTVTNASRIFTTVAFIAGFWIRRSFVIDWCKNVEDFYWRYRHRLRSAVKAKQKIELIMLTKYCITYANALLLGLAFYRITSAYESGFWHTAVISSLSLFLGTIVDQFCNILTHLLLHFECVNQSLHSVILQLKSLDHALSLGASKLLVRHRARCLQRHLTELNGMHHHCFWLTQRFFYMWQFTVACITLKIVMSNIHNLYHWVLFRNECQKNDSLAYLNGCLLTAVFYVDTILLISVIDALLEAGNKAGMLLHECGDLLQLRLCVETKITQTLEQFSLGLTCRRLSFSICGLFNFDRQMGLKCLVLALVQITVLLQYELQSKKEHK